MYEPFGRVCDQIYLRGDNMNFNDAAVALEGHNDPFLQEITATGCKESKNINFFSNHADTSYMVFIFTLCGVF